MPATAEDIAYDADDLALRYLRVPLEQRVFDRAVEIQGMLAKKAQHRAASITPTSS